MSAYRLGMAISLVAILMLSLVANATPPEYTGSSCGQVEVTYGCNQVEGSFMDCGTWFQEACSPDYSTNVCNLQSVNPQNVIAINCDAYNTQAGCLAGGGGVPFTHSYNETTCSEEGS